MRHIPNLLTCARLLLALAFPFTPEVWRTAVVASALLTEYLDGALSRRFGIASKMGQLLDPIADKLFFAAVVFVFIKEGDLTAGEFVLLGFRDLAVLAAVIWTLARGKYSLVKKMKPLFLGKAVTVFQYLVCFDILLTGSLQRALFCTTAAVSLAAAAQYAAAFRTMLGR